MRSILDVELIPGSTDRTGRGPISYYWWQFQENLNDYLSAVSWYETLTGCIRLHADHCHKYPKDDQAAAQLMAFRVQQEEASRNRTNATESFKTGVHEYCMKMLECAEVPVKYRPQAIVDFFDNAGSIRIRFGDEKYPRQHSGLWILYLNGALDRVRTPEGCFS